MYCPDCGRESLADDKFCVICGYPIFRLVEKLAREKEESRGWAEKIIETRSPVQVETKSVSDEKDNLVSFLTGLEIKDKKPYEVDTSKCERCHAPIEPGTMCNSCGDRLPGIFENDPYFWSAIRSPIKMIISPRLFATGFPYPIRGGILQPLLVPIIFAAIFIFTWPMGLIDMWAGRNPSIEKFLPAFISWSLASWIFTPLLLYAGSFLTHAASNAFGGFAQFRRTVRVLSAFLFWILMFGILSHLYKFLIFYLNKKINFDEYLQKFLNADSDDVSKIWRFLVLIMIPISAVIYGFMMGSLYRLKLWASITITVFIFIPMLFLWVYFLFIAPLKSAGFL